MSMIGCWSRVCARICSVVGVRLVVGARCVCMCVIGCWSRVCVRVCVLMRVYDWLLEQGLCTCVCMCVIGCWSRVYAPVCDWLLEEGMCACVSGSLLDQGVCVCDWVLEQGMCAYLFGCGCVIGCWSRVYVHMCACM